MLDKPDRGPCPMLNTLANHGYLPRTGRGISKDMAIKVLDEVLNWDVTVVSSLYDFAQPTNPEPNATTINLKELTTHNILEHDASLSRQDSQFGPADVFNAKIWNETATYFTGDTIDVGMAAKARTARTIAAASSNALFTFPPLGRNFQYGETSAYQFVFGKWNLDAEDVKSRILTPKNYIEYFFKNERLPIELGWKKPVDRLVMDTLQSFTISVMELAQTQMEEAA
ncbi:Cloroperoxidase [Periconia macrospinosa]|uniref:Cloroperoxidase n=1 Tax=Periconia macrospinosa TaxID=97972 RepID=A0A2V1DSJ2_9PLEO|nr:Cloroperoxidase [Periconia macrospinosa]